MSHPLPPTMVSPCQRRPMIYRGGIIQIMITRSCNYACTNCTQGSNLAGKPMVMTVDQFDIACRSLEGYWGVVACFGGNPATHPQFDKICEIMRASFPFVQRGIWTNDLMGKAAHARMTFNPMYSNLNMHLNTAAADEIRRDWPEAATYIKGETEDSLHSSPWLSMIDMGIPEEERWRLIGQCEINQWWSALIGVFRGELRAWFCELAGAQSMLHQDNPDWAGTGKPMPDTGLSVTPGWWRRPMEDFYEQVETHCHNCSIPMRRAGQPAILGGINEFSKTHEYIAKTKRKDQAIELVSIGGNIERSKRPVIEYLVNTSPLRSS